MIEMINFLTDYSYVKLWGLPFSNILGNDKDEKLAGCS